MKEEQASTLDCACMIEACQRCYSGWVERNRQAAEVYRCEGVIEYLIIAESPPCHHGRDIAPYIYRVQSETEFLKHTGLLYPIMRSLHKARLIDSIPDKKKDCLSQLKGNRVFVIDICEYPVNQMPSFIRGHAVSRNVMNLASRLHDIGVVNSIVTTMERSESEIQAAIEAARLQSIIRRCLPFPRGRDNQETFIDGLSDVFTSFPTKNEEMKAVERVQIR